MTKKYDAQGTIEKILSASAELFLEKGFEKTSMQDVAAAAGISKGAIYHHFQSKEEILNAVAERQALANRDVLERWLADTEALNGREKLAAILEKNLDSQQAHALDSVMCVRMKSAEFVLSYMQDCVNRDAGWLADIIRQGVADGSLTTAFPDECAEVFLLLLNVWCDPAVFSCGYEKLSRRLRFLQHLTGAIGLDVFDDALLEKTLELLQRLYPQETGEDE